MSEMDKYYQILGLNPGASEEKIKEAYKDLVKVWHPDRFSNDPRLKEKANEKLKEINSAYEILKAYMAGKSEQYTASGEGGNHAKSQPPPHEPPPKWEEEQSSTKEGGDYGDSEPPPNEPPPGFSQHSTQPLHSRISWVLLTLFFVVMGARIGSNFSNELIGAISGLLIGVGVSRFIDKMDATRKYKVRFAWGVAIGGFFLFIIVLGLTVHEHYTPTSSPVPSSPDKTLSSNPSPQTSEVTAVDWYNRGHSLLSSGNHRDAVNAFSRAIDLNPQFAEAYAYRGCAYYRLSDFEQAITDCSKAIELSPKDAVAYYYRGWAFFEKRHHDEALGDFNKAIFINPNGAGAYVGRGWVFLRKGQFDEALGDFNRAISIDTNDPAGAGYNGRGFTKYKKGQYNSSIEDFNNAIRINPNHPAIHYNRGYAYLELGNNRLATADFQKSIKFNKTAGDFIMRDCYIGLSIACFRQNKVEDAKANYREVIKIEPLCKKGLDALEKQKGITFTPSQKRTINEIVKLF